MGDVPASDEPKLTVIGAVSRRQWQYGSAQWDHSLPHECGRHVLKLKYPMLFQSMPKDLIRKCIPKGSHLMR